MTSRRSYTTNLATAALVAALLAASAWITIPVGAVPVTLQVFFVVLAALLLPPAWAGASIAGYIALGAVGLPIFSGAQGGLGVLAGPTGGYLAGFLVGAVVGAVVRQLVAAHASAVVADAACAAVVIAATYAIGATQLGIVLGMSPAKAFAAGVVPFVGVDAIKAFVAIGAAAAIRKARIA